MESWKPKIHHNYNNHKSYGRTKTTAPCRKHPKHRQSPGVCSLCLNQKLSRLTNTSSYSSSRSRRAAMSSSSSSSYISSLSSSDISSYSSPARKSTRAFKYLGQETLKKSRSMAFFLQRRKQENESGNNIEIKRGFWSRLLPTKNKVLMHSRTTRESVIAADVQ